MSVVETVKKSWGWAGIVPDSLIAENKFGNIIVKDVDGVFWRLCPEEAEINVVASSEEQLKALWDDEEFRVDWLMENLVQDAENQFGVLAEGQKFCFKIPGVLGGKYDISNIGTISFDEQLRFSGHVAKQIVELPDGSQIDLKFE